MSSSALLLALSLLALAETSDVPTSILIDSSGRLVTSRAVAAHVVLVEVPRGSVLSKDSAQDTSLLAYLDPFEGPAPRGLPHWASLPDDFVLALQLALRTSEEVAHGSATAAAADDEDGAASALGENATNWRSWLETAATQLDGTLHWTADEREWLEGSQALRHEAAHVNRVAWQLEALLSPLAAHDAAYFGGRPFSAASMRRLSTIVAAHALVPPETGRPVLLPLPQLPIEHGGSARVQLNVSSGAVQLLSTRALEVGAVLSIDAFGYEQSALMVRQGHPGVSPSRCLATTSSASAVDTYVGSTGSVALELALPEHDRLLEVKQVLLGKSGLKVSARARQAAASAPAASASHLGRCSSWLVTVALARPRPPSAALAGRRRALSRALERAAARAAAAVRSARRPAGARAALAAARRAARHAALRGQRRQRLPPCGRAG